jgi:hypothetical protein
LNREDAETRTVRRGPYSRVLRVFAVNSFLPFYEDVDS